MAWTEQSVVLQELSRNWRRRSSKIFSFSRRLVQLDETRPNITNVYSYFLWCLYFFNMSRIIVKTLIVKFCFSLYLSFQLFPEKSHEFFGKYSRLNIINYIVISHPFARKRNKSARITFSSNINFQEDSWKLKKNSVLFQP